MGRTDQEWMLVKTLRQGQLIRVSLGTTSLGSVGARAAPTYSAISERMAARSTASTSGVGVGL